MTSSRVFLHLQSVAQRLYKGVKSPRGQRIAWAIAVIVFFGGFAISVASQPGLISSFQPGTACLIVFILCPVMTALNMAVTRETARLAGVEMRFSAALKLAVMSAAANHLPAPGGPLLRTAAMQTAGASLKDAGFANVACGIAWISMTFLFAGMWVLQLDARLGAIGLGFGALFFAVTFGITRSLSNKPARHISLFVINFCSAAVYALSIYVALKAFGGAWSFPQATLVATAGVIGAASSITPSGLGIREAAAAGLASLIGAEPAAAFAATATVHLAMAAFTGALALYFLSRSKDAPQPA